MHFVVAILTVHILLFKCCFSALSRKVGCQRAESGEVGCELFIKLRRQTATATSGMLSRQGRSCLEKLGCTAGGRQ